MVDFISAWAKQIVIAVIVATIIEMLIPNGSSKKYIKTVIGIFILFNIITPIINKITSNNLDVSSIINIEEYTKQMESKENIFNSLETNNNSNIKEIYLYNLKKDIKSKLEAKEYIVNNVEINIENNSEYSIKNIKLTLEKNVQTEKSNKSQDVEKVNKIVINEIEEVNISIGNEEKEESKENRTRKLNNTEKNEIKEYLSSTYDINKKNITIN